MSMTINNKSNQPLRRFPEFRNTGKWTFKRLKEIARTFSGGTPSVGIKEYYGGTIPFIRSGEIANDKTELYITDLGLAKSSAKMVEAGTILYALYGATSGTVAISKIKGAINQAILAVIPDEDKYDKEYLYQFLKYQKPYILNCYLQGGQGNLSGAIINDLMIVLPCNADGAVSLAEQRKIAECFASLDRQIEAVKRKLELLKEHRKGLMQRLFPAKGKTMPEFRFPEFRNTGEWTEDMMQTIFEIKNGYTPSKTNPLYWENGTIPWFRMEDIRKNGHILSDSIQHITPQGVKSTGLFPANSIIVATTATIGEHALIIVDSLANQRFTFLTKRKSFCDKMDMLYFHYFMFIVDEWCKHNTNSGGLLSVNMDGFKKLKIPYPSLLEEQQKIAECFSSVDSVIMKCKDKISALELQKQGLMQQLFPQI